MQLRVVMGSGLILGALMVIAMVTYFANQEVYMTVDDLLASAAPGGSGFGQTGDVVRVAQASAAKPTGRRLQVRGIVDYSTVERPSEGLELRFTLRGDDGGVPVVFHGVVPDTFEIAESVTVGGRMSTDGTFTADQLFVQCPSKYESEPPGTVPDSSSG